MELSEISQRSTSRLSKSSTFRRTRRKKEREKNNSLKIEKFKKTLSCLLPIWHLSTAKKKKEHVKLVFSKNSQQCWKQMMLKELFNFLKKFNSPWDCKKTTKVPTKKLSQFPCDVKKGRKFTNIFDWNLCKMRHF